MPKIYFTNPPDHASPPLVRVGKLRWKQVPSTDTPMLVADIDIAAYIDTNEFGLAPQAELQTLLSTTLRRKDIQQSHPTLGAVAGYIVKGTPQGGWFAHTRANSSATICASKQLSTVVAACDKHWEPIAKEVKTLLTDRANELRDTANQQASINKRQAEEIQELFNALKADTEPYLY